MHRSLIETLLTTRPSKFRGKRQPVSSIVYSGYKIPYWEQIVELVRNLHDKIDYYTSIGWDVAITNSGPKVIELNSC